VQLASQRRPGRRSHLAAIGLVLLFGMSSAGCGALLLIGGAGTSAIAFATGELRSTEKVPLAELDRACSVAIETLGYDKVERVQQPGKIRWQALTASGDPVDIHLTAEGKDETELRIRIGVFGDEARSRLVREQIQQSLGRREGDAPERPAKEPRDR
jgi:hypothetical protein